MEIADSRPAATIASTVRVQTLSMAAASSLLRSKECVEVVMFMEDPFVGQC